MLLLDDKGSKNFKATQEIKVKFFSSAAGVPHDLGQITQNFHPILSPMTQQQTYQTQ